MPTVKLKIDSGLTYSPSDQVSGTQKLHNFVVGNDGSIYKIPPFRVLKNTKLFTVTDPVPPQASNYFPSPISDIKKFQTSALNVPIKIDSGPLTDSSNYQRMEMFRHFVYLTVSSCGTINIDYDGKRVRDSVFPEKMKRYKEFENVFLTLNNLPIEKTSPIQRQHVDLSTINSKILIDYNAQYNWRDTGEDLRYVSGNLFCVFPAQYRWVVDLDFKDEVKKIYSYPLLPLPRNMVYCEMAPPPVIQKRKTRKKKGVAAVNPPTPPAGINLKPLKSKEDIDYFNDKKYRYNNDLARGCFAVGNRMFFYSAVENAIMMSKSNDFSELEPNDDNNSDYRIIPTEELQGITDFNGNIITFSSLGMDRWLLSGDPETVLEKDPTFHYDHRLRFGGSFVKAHKHLFYYTDDFKFYKLGPDFNVVNIFPGPLPKYAPFNELLKSDLDLPLASFKMLGYNFISVGPWLFNVETNTWSTYSLDGWKNPQKPSDAFADEAYRDYFVYLSDLSKQIIWSGFDSVVCGYHSICYPLTYEELLNPSVFSDSVPSLKDPETVDGVYEYSHQWGEVGIFSTESFQDESIFSLDGVEVYVRGGNDLAGEKMWLKVLGDGDSGDIDEEDQKTFGVSAVFSKTKNNANGNIVGKYIWRLNIKADRFRLQFVSKAKRGIVVEGVLANITTNSDSQKFLVGGTAPQQA